MMRFLSGASCSCLVSFLSAFDFKRPAVFFCFFFPFLFCFSAASGFLTLLSPRPPLQPPYFPGVTTTTNYYSSKLFVVLTTSRRHPFNTAAPTIPPSTSTPSSLTSSLISASRGLRLFRCRTLWPGVPSLDSSVHIKLCHVSVECSGTII